MPFQKGNHLSNGNPFNKEVAQFKTILYKTVKKKDWKLIIQNLILAAKAGDKFSQKLLAEYLINKPTTQIDVNGSIPLKLYDATDADKV